jgi:hypothetical protein
MLTAVVPPPTSLPASLPRTASDERLMLPASMRGISVQVAAEIAAPSWAIAAAEVTAEKAAEAALWETEAGRALVHTWLRRSFLIDVAEPAPLRRQAACPDAPDECLSLSPEQSPICNGTLLFEVATRLADPALRLAEEAAREGLAAGPRRRRPPYPKPRAPMHSEANLLAAVDELRRGVTGGRVVVPRTELVLLRRAVASVTAGDTQPVWRLLSWLRKFNPAPPAAAPPRRASRRAHHDASREDGDPISDPISEPILEPISEPISLLLVGGHGAHDGASLPIWQYTVGEHSCESAPTKGAELGGTAASAPQPSAQHGAARAAAGCAFGFGEQCDTLRGICVCADGTPPPCDPLTGGRRAALPIFGDGALSQIGTAWLIVGVSAAGAWVGRFARVLVTLRDATARI